MNVMKAATLKSKTHQTIAHVEIDSRGMHQISGYDHKTLGYYDPRTNRTSDRMHRVIGYGYQLPRLLDTGLTEEGAGIIEPLKPLDARELAKRNERHAKVAQDVQDETKRHADRVRDLRGRAGK
jgi:hypothetical protein